MLSISSKTHSRQQLISQLTALEKSSANTPIDLAIIGGGATGLGIALEAAARGMSVILLERQDFAKGTSSRATKLLHGGVRYMAQGNLGLVREALHERTTVLQNAPHLAQAIEFVLPCYRVWQAPFYGLGLKLYDSLAGDAVLGKSHYVSKAASLQQMTGLNPRGLSGAISYWDAQFDDARLALALARSASSLGALLLNYCSVDTLQYDTAKIVGLRCTDQETGKHYSIATRCVINATGVWADGLRQYNAQHSGVSGVKKFKPMVRPSQGVHLVVDQSFLPGTRAMIVPKTSDGRVLFAVPWLGKLLLGTTDTARKDISYEPKALDSEIEFILREAGNYLARPPTRADVRSIWVGLRPLVDSSSEAGGSTGSISREHAIEITASGLVTVTGGKWTTYRAMASTVLKKCFETGLLQKPALRVNTASIQLIGAIGKQNRPASSISAPPGKHLYGSEVDLLNSLPGSEHEIAAGLTEAMVRFAARYEFARTTEDVLARRSRMLFLDAQKAIEVAPQVAKILAQETGIDPQLDSFITLAKSYLLTN